MIAILSIFDYSLFSVAELTENAPNTLAAMATTNRAGLVHLMETGYAEYVTRAQAENAEEDPDTFMERIIAEQATRFPKEDIATESTDLPFLDDLPTLLQERATNGE